MSKKLIEQLHPVGFATQSKRIEELEREIAELVELYEQALIASWPDGAMGDAYDFWNEARKARKP